MASFAAWQDMEASQAWKMEASLPIRPPPGLEDFAPAATKMFYEDSDAMSTFVGTEVGSLASMSTSGYSNSPRESLHLDHLFQDLCNFREAVICRLLSAQNSMSETDEDLAVAVGQIVPWIEELCQHAQTVQTQLFALADIATWPGISPTGKESTSLDGVRKQSRKVRGEYVLVLERLRYITRCTVAVWADTMEADPLNVHGANFLEMGLSHLRALIDLMEESTDFWMALHRAELSIGEQKAFDV